MAKISLSRIEILTEMIRQYKEQLQRMSQNGDRSDHDRRNMAEAIAGMEMALTQEQQGIKSYLDGRPALPDIY